MVGPGLFMALALLVPGARAEVPVGLDAKGVNPMSAVDNRLGLDVRDELGRPVSGRLVLEQLKAAQAARTAQNSFTSRLPRARLILPALESAAGRGTWLVQLIDAIPSAAALASLPTPRPKVSAFLLVMLGCLLAATASTSGSRSQQTPAFLCSARREILRC